MPPKAIKKKKYSKMNPLEHILHRPDTFVGSTRTRKVTEYVSDEKDEFKINQKEITFNPALLRIFVEPLSNAVDNVARSKKTKTPCTKIKIEVDKKTGKTSVWNNGESIVVGKDNDEDMWNHTLIFGHLLTSSNYDDEEDREDISGRNGLGGKLSNVFSTSFNVKGYDPTTKKLFEQEWTNNMKTVGKPKIKTSNLKNGYTEVTWYPDFKQFKLKGYSDDMLQLYCKYAVDAAMLTGVNVYFNGNLIPVKTMINYANLYDTIKSKNVLNVKTKNSSMVLVPSSSFKFISFANGVYTSLGGTHVDAWVEALFRPIVKKLNKTQPKTKTKKITYSIGDVKKFFKIFVTATVSIPEFESQSKHKLESPFSVKVPVKNINSLLRWSVIDEIKRSKEMVVLKSLERKKKNFVKVSGLDSANNEGGKNGRECTLILVEGLSAKTYAVQGIEVGAFGKQGRDWFGIYALRGKVLNVRNAKAASIAKNNVISDIFKALNVKHDVDYTSEENYKTLRYGRVMIITDADVDGIHISGLIKNMFHSLFPSLLEREQSYVTSMHTPIVRVYTGTNKCKLFYDERKYEKYIAKMKRDFPNKKIKQKYYKGLGTSSNADILETFGKKLIQYKIDDKTTENMEKVFLKKKADLRKIWLKEYDSTKVAVNWTDKKEEIFDMKISDFLNTELIKFSINDCKRSIPNIMDGLKEGQRKVLFSCFLRNLKYTGKALKVAQLGAYSAEKSAYHHGEQNLLDTITKMTQEFPGSNNIPVLFRGGQLGTRIAGGKDAANGRYTFTKLDKLTRYLYREEDDVLLERILKTVTQLNPNFMFLLYLLFY